MGAVGAACGSSTRSPIVRSAACWSPPLRAEFAQSHSAIFAEPSDIATRYQKALDEYLAGLKQVVLESAIDYSRVTIDEDYEKVLVRFLMSRAQAKGLR